MGKHPSQNATARALPKLCGADIELGNFIAGTDKAGGTGYEASRALLAEIEGLPIRQSSYVDNWWSTASTAPAHGCQQSCGNLRHHQRLGLQPTGRESPLSCEQWRICLHRPESR